jgi:cell wall-associated NlpC family hydrolase
MRGGRTAAGVLVAAFVIGLAVVAGGATGQDTSSAVVRSVAQLAAQTCSVSGPVSGLDPDQATDADLIVSAAMTATDENTHAAQIAVMTAMTESGLHNLDHRDRDSLGLFQQRPSQGWGTPAQLMDPTYAANAFVERLIGVPGWQSMPPWLAAQAVQHSAFADGSNYQPNWKPAGQIVAAALANGNQPGSCGQGAGGLAGPTSAHGLPAGYQIPPGTPPEHHAVVAFTLAQLGKPYVWGAAGPDSFDCSGLTMAAWGSVGIPLLHYTGDQQHEGVGVTAATLTPGDLLLTPGSDSPASGVAGHVGLFIGDGLVLSAIDPQLGVAVQSWSTFVSGGLIALRDPAPDA